MGRIDIICLHGLGFFILSSLPLHLKFDYNIQCTTTRLHCTFDALILKLLVLASCCVVITITFAIAIAVAFHFFSGSHWIQQLHRVASKLWEFFSTHFLSWICSEKFLFIFNAYYILRIHSTTKSVFFPSSFDSFRKLLQFIQTQMSMNIYYVHTQIHNAAAQSRKKKQKKKMRWSISQNFAKTKFIRTRTRTIVYSFDGILLLLLL